MKIKITLISLLILLSSLGHILEGQTTACVNDTLKLYITNYRGSATWQQSLNGTDWTPLSDTGDTLQLIATQHQYYRTEIIEGTCQPVYSDIIELIINDPPVVTLNPKDSTCLNETAFILSGGSPAGGTYWGDGVVDGKFNPQMAGTGLHELFYSYRDPETHCADTASAMIRVLPLPDEAHAGDDQTDLVVDSVQLDGNSPVNGTGTWTIIEGPGGSFSDLHDPNSWFYKNDTILDYQLRWAIETPCGSNSDEVLLNFALLSKNPCPGTPLVTDADGNVYPTLQIGNQCWMAKNLNAGVFIPSNSTGTNHSELSDN
ncbi:MAG: hypothetical protein J7L89_06665, partial [Bacteroidales bacterium]|nr:hypothetical protein [Bacteroidales bacterium]